MKLPAPASMAAAAVGVTWLAHTTAIDRLDVTKLAVALVAASLASALVFFGRSKSSDSPRGAPNGVRTAGPAPRNLPPPHPEETADPARRQPLVPESPPPGGGRALAVAGICIAAASILFPDFVLARVESWAPWIAAALLFGLVRRSPSRDVALVLTAFAAVIAVVGLAQALGATWFIADLTGFRGRPVMATLGNPDLLGVCLAGALPFAAARARGWQYAVVAAVILAATITAGSRTAWVMLLPSAVLLFRLGRRALPIAVAGLALAAVVAITSPRLDLGSRIADLGDDGGTAAGRLYLWRVNLELLADAGPLGAGPGAFQRRWPAAQAAFLGEHPSYAGFHSDLRHAHADPVEIAVDYGWLALLACAWGVLRLFGSGRGYRDSSPARASLAALLLGGLAHPVLFQVPSLALAALAAGVLAPPLHRIPGRAWQLATALAVALALFWTTQRVVSEVQRNAGLRAELAGRPEEAQAHYRGATTTDPTNPLAQWLLARSLLDRDPEAALIAARSAAHELPTWTVYALLATAAEAAGHSAEASEARAKAVALRPRTPASAPGARVRSPGGSGDSGIRPRAYSAPIR